MRTRLWNSENGSNTCVQFRTDSKPMVWVHSNIGWLGMGNTPENEAEAEKFAEETAEGYGLVETTPEEALYMAGWTGE